MAWRSDSIPQTPQELLVTLSIPLATGQSMHGGDGCGAVDDFWSGGCFRAYPAVGPRIKGGYRCGSSRD